MQKVRSCLFSRAAYKTTIKFFSSRNFTLLRINHIQPQRKVPLYSNRKSILLGLATLLYFSLYVESRLIFFPKVNQIFLFTLFIYQISLSIYLSFFGLQQTIHNNFFLHFFDKFLFYQNNFFYTRLNISFFFFMILYPFLPPFQTYFLSTLLILNCI